MTDTVPPTLLAAVTAPGGGQLALVVGAGCSVEKPTNLPTSAECANSAHLQLVANGVLADGECTDPTDLSCLADLTYKKCGTQSELVQQLPVSRFRNAQPNEGYLIAAALLREQAVAALLTLNFDLAMSHALSQINAGEDVAVVFGPQDHDKVGLINLIFLHRTATAQPDEWILRTEQLKQDWEDQVWEQVMAVCVVARPKVVFVGLGSPAAVLIDTVKRVKATLSEDCSVFQVDPGERNESRFASELNVDKEQFLKMGWVAFMRGLGARVAAAQIQAMHDACQAMIQANAWHNENCTPLLANLDSKGLLGIGKVRAKWFLRHEQYASARNAMVEHIADLVLALALLERELETTAVVNDDGIVVLTKDNELICTIVPLSGSGHQRFPSLVPQIKEIAKQIQYPIYPSPTVFLLAGVQGPCEDIPVPADIVAESGPENLVTGGSGLPLTLEADALRQSPALIRGLINHG